MEDAQIYKLYRLASIVLDETHVRHSIDADIDQNHMLYGFEKYIKAMYTQSFLENDFEYDALKTGCAIEGELISSFFRNLFRHWEEKVVHVREIN